MIIPYMLRTPTSYVFVMMPICLDQCSTAPGKAVFVGRCSSQKIKKSSSSTPIYLLTCIS